MQAPSVGVDRAVGALVHMTVNDIVNLLASIEFNRKYGGEKRDTHRIGLRRARAIASIHAKSSRAA